MKKFILTILTIFFCACTVYLPRTTARADTAPSYACVTVPDAYFYASRDDKRGLFLLPESYYVKVLDFDGDYCRAEYLIDDEYTRKLIGYVRADALAFVDYIPTRPYFYHLFEVSYTLENGNGGESGFLDKITLTCSYYGDYIVGSQTYCYVFRDGAFGYIPKPQDLITERNLEYDEWLRAKEEPQPPTNSSTAENTASPAQITILISVCLLVPVLAALILRSPRPPEPEE